MPSHSLARLLYALLLSLALLSILSPALGRGEATLFPVPAEARSDHFRVTVDGRPAQLMHAATGYYTLSFSLRGSARITITASSPEYWRRGVEVQPWRENIRPVVHGRTISFTLNGPAKLSIARPGDHFADSEMLFLFAEPPETYIPSPRAGVRFYAPGAHHENIDAHSGDLIYLAPGAVIFGSLNLWQVDNVRVLGRGTIIYDGPQDPHSDQGWMHKPNWHCIVMDNAHNIEIDGITCIVRSRTWQIQMKDSRHISFNNVKVIGGNPNDANQDGLDWLGGGDTAVRNSFFRASDDVFALQGNWDGYSEAAMLAPGHDVTNITIENTIVSTSISNIVRLAWPQKIFNSSNFLMRDVDVLHMGYGSCGIPFGLLGVWADKGAVGEHYNYRFEDIRLEDWYSLLQIDKPLPGVHGVELDRVQALDSPSMVPSQLQGAVTDTVLNSVAIGGKVAAAAADVPLEAADGAEAAHYRNTSPTPSIDYTPGALAPHQRITLTASGAASTDAKYLWLFGDGASATGPSVDHAFPDADGTLRDGSGRFRVLLQVTDSKGVSVWTSRPVIVGSTPHPAAPQEATAAGLAVTGTAGMPSDLPSGVLPNQLASLLASAPVGTSLRFSGFVDVPADGGYTLWLLASGPSTLSIDGQTLATSPEERKLVCGTPGNATQPATGSLVMRKGLHRIEISAQRAAGVNSLALKWEGPGILLTDVPDAALRHPEMK